MSDTDATPKKPARKSRKAPAKTARRKTAAPPAASKETGPAQAAPAASAPRPTSPEAPATNATPASASGKSAPSKSRRSKSRSTTASAARSDNRPLTSAAHPVQEASTGSPPAERPAPAALIRVPMPVRWRDLDAFNHVNNSKYLSYLEEARLQWMLTVPGMGMDDHVAPVVAAAQLNYRRPITWPSQVEIELFVERLGNTSLTVGHRIVDSTDKAALFCDGHVVMVWIDRDSGAAAALPAAVREACGG